MPAMGGLGDLAIGRKSEKRLNLDLRTPKPATTLNPKFLTLNSKP